MSEQKYIDWRTFKATGVNLGGWLVIEANMDPEWIKANGGSSDIDEWTFTANLGDKAAEVLEKRYSTLTTTSFIDQLVEKAGVNILRIPMTYAAWVTVPGSKLYSGKQIEHMSKIAMYAIEKYGMHIIIDIHSLPGGYNGLTIGEATGHYDWFDNEHNLDLSMQVIQKVLDFVQNSGYPQHFTIAPMNEPADNRDFSTFGTPKCLGEKGAAWVKKYFDQVIELVKSVNPKIPVMLQTFMPEQYWSPQFPEDANIVFDVHNYYFQHSDVTSETLVERLEKDARGSMIRGDGKFPTFVGEWSIQTGGLNTFEYRRQNFQAALRLYEEFAQGSTMWSGRHFGEDSVPGEGVLKDYWSFETLMNC